MREFFLDWALRDVIKAHPRTLVHLEDCGVVVMGYVPNEWDGTTMDLFAKPKEMTNGLQRKEG